MQLSLSNVACARSSCAGYASCMHRGWTSQQMPPMQDGVIAAGLANGAIEIWDPAKLAAGKGDAARIAKLDKHKGPVGALKLIPPSLLMRQLTASCILPVPHRLAGSLPTTSCVEHGMRHLCACWAHRVCGWYPA